jgi:hypothetical protein
MKVGGCTSVYHCMTRTVNGERLLGGSCEGDVAQAAVNEIRGHP